MHTDIRTKYTKTLIQDTFFELLKTTPLKKISVKKICEKAEINRSTFYHHFIDVYDLIEQVENTYINRFIEYSNRETSLDSAMEYICNYVANNHEIYMLIATHSLDIQFMHKIYDISYSRYRDQFIQKYPDWPEDTRRYMYDYIVSGTLGVLTDWIENGMEISPKEIAIIISQLHEKILDIPTKY